MRINICLGILLALFSSVKGEEWRGIKPLYSTRADVEQILGKPIDKFGMVYKLPTESATIEYSDGVCSEDYDDWNVPKDTVVSIRVGFQSSLFSELKLDLTKFEIIKHPNYNNYYYINRVDGIFYDVREDYTTKVENLIAVEYFPAAKDKQLLCHKETKEN